MKSFAQLLTELEPKITYHNRIAPFISQSSVGWHIEHILLSNKSIIRALQKSDPENYHWKFNVKRIIVFAFHTIPRGKAKARNIVIPQKELSHRELIVHYYNFIDQLLEYDVLADDNFFTHPLLGNLNKKNAYKFMYIHTLHHLKIIDDILNHKPVQYITLD